MLQDDFSKSIIDHNALSVNDYDLNYKHLLPVTVRMYFVSTITFLTNLEIYLYRFCCFHHDCLKTTSNSMRCSLRVTRRKLLNLEYKQMESSNTV